MSGRRTHLTSNHASREAKAAFAARHPIASVVRDAIDIGGKPLDPSLRGSFERSFGHDFSAVRVHTDARAAESARSLRAQAFTFGSHIAFAHGRYAPQTPHGARLLAHELAHVAQHAGRDPGRFALFASSPGTPAERAADRSADAFMLGQSARGSLHSFGQPAVVHRAPADSTSTEALHSDLIEQYRRANGLPPHGRDAEGNQVGPTDSEIRFSGLLADWIARTVVPRTETRAYGVYQVVPDSTTPRVGNQVTQAELTRLDTAWTRVGNNSGGMTINGSAADRAAMIAMIAAEMGRSRSFRDLIIEITEDTAHPVVINAGRDNAFAFDEFPTLTADLDDLEFLDENPPAAYPWAWTRGEDIVHWLAERRHAALTGSGFGPAHSAAMAAGGRQEQYRRDRGQAGRIVGQTGTVSAGLFAGASADSNGNQTITRMDISGGSPVIYELEYRPATPTAAAPGLSRLSHMDARVSSNSPTAEQLFVRFSSASATVSTAVQATGSAGRTFSRPLRDVVPTGGPVTVQVLRDVPGGAPVVVLSFTWANPFAAASSSASQGGVQYDLTIGRTRR